MLRKNIPGNKMETKSLYEINNSTTKLSKKITDERNAEKESLKHKKHFHLTKHYSLF